MGDAHPSLHRLRLAIAALFCCRALGLLVGAYAHIQALLMLNCLLYEQKPTIRSSSDATQPLTLCLGPDHHTTVLRALHLPPTDKRHGRSTRGCC
jgi:hypothetical protein